MPPPYTTLNARVKQKIATEAAWLAVDDELGVIFTGEQAFVYNEDGVAVNFKIGDGTKKFSELPYFIAYYNNVVNHKVLPYLDQTGNLSIPTTFRNNSFLKDIIFINNSGTQITLDVGITSVGGEVFNALLENDITCIDANYFFTSSETLYLTGLTAKNYSVFLLYIQIDEAPVTPPSGGGGGTTLFPKGYKAIFEPVYPGHENDVWDFVTGLGKPGTGYDNCALSGTNGTRSMAEKYPVGWKVGQTIGATIGNSTGVVTIASVNLPEHSHRMFTTTSMNVTGFDLNSGEATVCYMRNAGINRDYGLARDNIVPTMGKTSIEGYTNPDPISIIPYSSRELWFVAITDPS